MVKQSGLLPAILVDDLDAAEDVPIEFLKFFGGHQLAAPTDQPKAAMRQIGSPWIQRPAASAGDVYSSRSEHAPFGSPG